MSFSSLGLSDNILKGIRAMGYEDPTPIQLRGIPLFLEGRDLIGSAQTGTGKTAAFGLPILTKLDKPADTPRALIVEPTRELASQVETAFRDFSRYSDLRTTVVYGGVKYGKQTDALKNGTDIVVATPGRFARPLVSEKFDTKKHPVPRARRGRPDARHGLHAGRQENHPELSGKNGTHPSSQRPFRLSSRRSSSGR